MSTDPGAPAASRVLAALHAEILACRACEDRGFLPAARPVREPTPIGARIMVVGQAPGARSDAARRHFIGPAGALLEHWFELAGFSAGYLRREVYLTAVTRCFPGKSPSGAGDRVPSPPERALCRGFLDREIELVSPRLILPVGSLAIQALLGSLKLVEAVGTLRERGDHLFLPLPHSSPVSRWLNDQCNRERVDRATRLLAWCRTALDLA
jgi:uracil-DNA glycosylase family 4